MRDITILMGLLKESNEVVTADISTPTIHCTIFGDNKWYINLVETPHIKHCTNHIALTYHNFSSLVKSKTLSIRFVEKNLQHGDIFTKAFNDVLFIKLEKLVSGW